MCVTVVLILKGQIEISKEKEKQWFYSYIGWFFFLLFLLVCSIQFLK